MWIKKSWLSNFAGYKIDVFMNCQSIWCIKWKKEEKPANQISRAWLNAFLTVWKAGSRDRSNLDFFLFYQGAVKGGD